MLCGEAGSYWGGAAIKAHRGNFRFFGAPKDGVPPETPVHEARHRASPHPGLRPEFYDLVNRDTRCVLRHW